MKWYWLVDAVVLLTVFVYFLYQNSLLLCCHLLLGIVCTVCLLVTCHVYMITNVSRLYRYFVFSFRSISGPRCTALPASKLIGSHMCQPDCIAKHQKYKSFLKYTIFKKYSFQINYWKYVDGHRGAVAYGLAKPKFWFGWARIHSYLYRTIITCL